MNNDGFLHNYYDWALFEDFVRQLYAADGDVVVEHDVTEMDRYGARRQTDLKITRRTRFHTYVTLVECKRWKDPVGRDRIDVLAASVEALGAQKGAFFTTSGYEAGAIEYAKGKGIDIFVIRDLTPTEWGRPGRHLRLRLHTWAGEFRQLRLGPSRAILLVDDPLEEIDLQLRLEKEQAYDPDLDLRSVKTGARGPNLISVFAEVHGLILSAAGKAFNMLKNGEDGERLELNIVTEILFDSTDFHQLRLPRAAVRLTKIEAAFVATVNQTEVAIDRGATYDFAVVVENYISSQRQIAHKKKGEAPLSFAVVDPTPSSAASETIEDGTLIKVFTSPWVSIGSMKPTMRAFAGNMISVVAAVDGEGKLSLHPRSLLLSKSADAGANEATPSPPEETGSE